MNDPSAATYDAVVVVSFGGPDKREDVIPFLENVLRGRNVPRERMTEVAEHYYHLGGKSPINDQNRALVAALQNELARKGPAIPVYLGNRNWHPLLADTLREMATDGVRRALAFVTSAYGSYSGCRQYLDDIARAQQQVGASAPTVDKLRLFYNHPGFIEATAERVKQARDQLPSRSRAAAHLVYTAHSIPTAMAADSPYVEQLHEACRLVSEGVGREGLDPGVSKPQRASFPALARARHQRLSASTACLGRPMRSDRRADRIYLRPHGGALRPGHGSTGPVRGIGAGHGPRGDRRSSSEIHRHDPGSHPGANGAECYPPRLGQPGPVAQPLSRRLLPAAGKSSPQGRLRTLKERWSRPRRRTPFDT